MKPFNKLNIKYFIVFIAKCPSLKIIIIVIVCCLYGKVNLKHWHNLLLIKLWILDGQFLKGIENLKTYQNLTRELKQKNII